MLLFCVKVAHFDPLLCNNVRISCNAREIPNMAHFDYLKCCVVKFSFFLKKRKKSQYTQPKKSKNDTKKWHLKGGTFFAQFKQYLEHFA